MTASSTPIAVEIAARGIRPVAFTFSDARILARDGTLNSICTWLHVSGTTAVMLTGQGTLQAAP